MVIKAPYSGMSLKFLELAEKILTDVGLSLYDLEWNSASGELKVFIIDPQTKTATLDDCVKVDRGFNPYMESETWIPENFTLEVSSPGLFRQLNTVNHFKEVVGSDILITLISKVDEQKYPEFPKSMRNNLKIKVKLLSANDEFINIDAKGVSVDIPYTQIKRANLETNINNHQPN
jgi:ribosome maturation factor RimP